MHLVERIFLLAGLLATTGLQAAPDPYVTDQFDLFAGMANHRPVDGLDYYDGDGVLSAGLRYAHPAGFYVAAQGLHGAGDGVQMPDTGISNLEAAIGWIHFIGDHGFSVELQDYRFHLSGFRASGQQHVDYQAFAVNYRIGGFRAELGLENDKPLYYYPLDRFFRYSNRRAAIAYRFPLGERTGLQLSAGHNDFDRLDLQYNYAAVQFDWQWQMLQWTLSYTVASNDIETFYSYAADRDTLTLGVSVSFDIFRSAE